MEDNILGKFELERIIVKELELVSCDIPACEYYGEMFYCYLDNHKKCPMYLDYMSQNK